MKQIFSQNKFLMLVAVLGMAIAPTKAMAHQVQTDYILDSQAGNSLQLRTTFSNGQPLKGAKVTVTSPNQPYRIRAVGKTDSQGRFTFVPDQPISGDWEVNIKREGHQDILTVPVTEAGIDLDLMAQNGLEQVGNTDVHYASSPWMVMGGVAIAAACLGVARTNGKKQAE
ncbi:carboxypeptidase regulatory-like domain-containing protein [cf. Phormidesmis sp. LEGE 11477]|uniref:carboxypeptidase regulatory-like domain-containing protein n=1 Tax=cf. Phormidesmis sp. LEGE 11477 TaxID=1828680 RepID=UPI00187F00CA|nr:carboxypeptidase regulatory-like domain-containing protein [cf. Phormidesmis sp. LEGE 11477]MBE9062820.1 carboxypeptidase regulatory-like domain-containing protein [cf. Phormidesmis sp. LEGE 11477]